MTHTVVLLLCLERLVNVLTYLRELNFMAESIHGRRVHQSAASNTMARGSSQKLTSVDLGPG